MKPKNYTVNEVLKTTMISFTFNFYCSKDTKFIIEDFKSITNKNINLTNKNDIEPTNTTYILLKEYDGKRPRYQFKTSFYNYNDISTFLNTILFWLNENATLTTETILKTTLYFNFNELKTYYTISNMDKTKLIVKMNEDYIYKRFNDAKINPLSLSIKKLIPYNMSVNASSGINIKNQFKLPNEIYYGVDFTEQTNGLLSFNYICGNNYAEKVNEIYELLQYYILTTYQSLNDPEYTKTDVFELNNLTEEYRKFRKCYYDYKLFKELYKDIKVYIDLRENIVETRWTDIRDGIATLILESNVKKGIINYDSDIGVFELKNAVILNSVIKDYYITNSKITGVVEDCLILNSEIKNTRIKNTVLLSDNNIDNCYLNNVRVDRDNKITDCYIENNGQVLNCTIHNSVIINSVLGTNAKLDIDCLIVQPVNKMINPDKNGIEIKEVRDYNWLKSLRDKDYKDAGFANQYKNNY